MNPLRIQFSYFPPTVRAVLSIACLVVACPEPVFAQTKTEATVERFYRADEVQTIKLEITPEHQKKLVDALPKRIFVPATFHWNGKTLSKVGVRFKGNSSSNPQQKHKRSYLLKFDKYQKAQRFLGLRRASLDNGVQFGSVFSEPIITEILADLGLTTHRANHARLFVNDEFVGVYVNVERVDDVFLKTRLHDEDGALYKVDEGGNGSNLRFLGHESDRYRDTFEAKSDSAELHRKELVGFIELINGPQSAAVNQRLEKHFQLEEFFKVMAVMLHSGAFDQLTGWNPHNYYLFRHSQPDRAASSSQQQPGQWRYLPWDLDVGFAPVAFGRIQVLKEWHAAWPAPPTPHTSPLIERIVNDAEWLEQYREISKHVLENYFEPARLCGVLDQKYAMIRDDLEKDPFPHRRATNPRDQGYNDIVSSMKEFMHARYKKSLSELTNPGPRPKFKPPQDREPQFPPWVQGSLKKKLLIVHKEARKIRLERDRRWVHEVMKQVGPLVHKRKTEEAERLVDEAIKRLGRIGSDD